MLRVDGGMACAGNPLVPTPASRKESRQCCTHVKESGMIPQTMDASLDPVTPYFTFRKVVHSGADFNPLKDIFALRYEVYCIECGYLPPDQFQNGLESDEYDAHSAHFTAHNLDSEVVGTLRLVKPAATQVFPFERYCRTLYGDVSLPSREECGEISRLVVRKNYRRRIGDSLSGIVDCVETRRHERREGSDDRRSSGPQILLGLYRAVYRHSLQTGVRYWFAAMEKSLARSLARFDFVFTPIGLETDYHGPVTPYMADLRELENRLSEHNPELLDWFRGRSSE